jgi:hypothetical protein
MGTVGFFGLHTPLVWIEVVLLVQAMHVGTGTGAGRRPEVSRYLTVTAPCRGARRAVLMSPLTPWTGSWVTWRASLASRPTA